MRRLIFASALAALLAFPALALAHDGHGGGKGGNGHHGKHAGRLFFGANGVAAQLGCRNERQQIGKNDNDNDGDNGANQNTAGAFGQCVSTSVKLGRHGGQLEFATGTISSFGAAGCNTATAGCVLTASGTIEGKPILHGTWSASLTAVWTSATATGDGGYCAPTTGTVLLSDGTNSLTESVQGNLCEIGATGANVGHFFTGTAAVTSGTGTYATATGKAKLAFYQPTGSNAITAVQRGSIATP